jgi:hypothetical protein
MHIDIQKILSRLFKPLVRYSICGFVGQPYREIASERDWARAQRAACRLHLEGWRGVCIIRQDREHREIWHYDGYTFEKAQQTPGRSVSG